MSHRTYGLCLWLATVIALNILALVVVCNDDHAETNIYLFDDSHGAYGSHAVVVKSVIAIIVKAAIRTLAVMARVDRLLPTVYHQ